MMLKTRLLLAGATFASMGLALSVATAASAQTELANAESAQTEAGQVESTKAAPADTIAAAEEEITGNEIIVTAQKRAQNVQDVPISMGVVSGSMLEKFNNNDLKAIANYVPNVYVQTTAGNNVIYIRGFGSPPANFGFDQAVSLYVDGVYAGKSRQSQQPFFDIERVEVLRGPQGALFGKNTAAGAVSVVSAKPTSHTEASLNTLYNFDQAGFETWGYFSGPVSDTLGVRLALKFTAQDGYITNQFNGVKEPRNDEQLGRLTIKWEPTADFDLTAIADYGNHDVTGGSNVSSSLTGPQDPHNTRFLTPSSLGPEGTSTESLMLSATANWRIGDYTITSVTGWSQFNSNIINGFDQTIPSGGYTTNSVYNSFPEDFSQFSEELRLASPSGEKFEYIVGLYYDTSDYHLTQLGGFDIPALNYYGLSQTDFQQNAHTFSAFGQLIWPATEDLRFVGSLRYTTVSKDADFTGKLIYGPFPLRPLTNATGSLSEDGVDPSITAQYDFNKDVMVYATYAEGSKSGGFVSNTYGTIDSTFQYKPEQSQNIEAGVKSKLADGKVILNGTIYHTKFSNLQTSVYNPNTSSYVTGNAASASSTGIEAEFNWYPMPNLDFSASGAYQDAKYDDYPGASCLASQPMTECNPLIPASVQANNIAGRPLTYSSKFTGNFTAHYRIDFAGDYKFDTTMMIYGRSWFYNSDDQSPNYGVQNGYAKLDLRLQVAPHSDRWHVALVGKNLTNQYTTSSAFRLPAPITSAPRAIMYLDPLRSIALEAGVRF